MDIVNESMQDLMNYGANTCFCGDIRQLPFRDKPFDIVFSKGSLHHSQPIDEPLRSIIRVCKQSGISFSSSRTSTWQCRAIACPGAGSAHAIRASLSEHGNRQDTQEQRRYQR
jgi:ubiquinone/menaquinone biosynthesis C-methylase UbiE